MENHQKFVNGLSWSELQNCMQRIHLSSKSALRPLIKYPNDVKSVLLLFMTIISFRDSLVIFNRSGILSH